MIDFRDKMKTIDSDIQTFSFGQDLVFDAFIMFKEYIGFVKAMNSLKGMKLLYKDRYEDRAWVANIKVLRLFIPYSKKELHTTSAHLKIKNCNSNFRSILIKQNTLRNQRLNKEN